MAVCPLCVVMYCFPCIGLSKAFFSLSQYGNGVVREKNVWGHFEAMGAIVSDFFQVVGVVMRCLNDRLI